MSKYGPYPLNNRVMTLSDLGSIVVCVQTTPDVNQMEVGGVLHYIGADDGRYIFNHIYKCVEVNNVKTWEDITFGMETVTSFPNKGSVIILGNKHLYSWGKRYTSAQDIWDHDVVVRKLGSVPAHPDDGEIMLISNTYNQYCTTPYTTYHDSVDDTITTVSGQLTSDYKYRVFHVATTGAWSFTEMDVVNYEGWELINFMANKGILRSAFPPGTVFTLNDHTYKVFDNNHILDSEYDTETRKYVVVDKSDPDLWVCAQMNSDISAISDCVYTASFSAYQITSGGTTRNATTAEFWDMFDDEECKSIIGDSANKWTVLQVGLFTSESALRAAHPRTGRYTGTVKGFVLQFTKRN